MESTKTRLNTTAVERKLGIQNQGEGRWGPVFDLEVIPIHAMLVPPGNKVLFYGTNDEGRRHEPFGNNIFYEVWNLEKGARQDEAHHLLDFDSEVDIFCSNMNVDTSTGNIIVIGGDTRTGLGVNNAMEYNYKTREVRVHPKGNMLYERWYPTSINLPNGDIFVVGGYDQQKRGSAIPEVWSPGTGFRQLKQAKIPMIAQEPNSNHWWYPHTFVNSKGDIIIIMPKDLGKKRAQVYRVDVEGEGSIERVGKKPFKMHVRSPSILFRTNQVLMLSNSGRLWVADISDGSSPKWEKKTKIRSSRTNGSMMMLPDGRVGIVGGCRTTDGGGKVLSKAVKDIEIWDPDTDTVIDGDKEKRARLYHSTSLILPDGRVFSGGGGSPGPETNLNGQLFSPGYLFDQDQKKVIRSSIVECPRNVKSGDAFVITVNDASRITKVTATKSGASTHTRNCDTRWLDLKFDVLDDTDLRVYAENKNIMIGGLWLVNVLDENGVPSEAAIVGVNMAAFDFDESN